MIKIYLDDERPTPDGYIRTYTVKETINLLIEHEGNVDILSLDNDLGEISKFNRYEEGRQVARWLEEAVLTRNFIPPRRMRCHSANVEAQRDMRFAFSNISKFFKQKQKQEN